MGKTIAPRMAAGCLASANIQRAIPGSVNSAALRAGGFHAGWGWVRFLMLRRFEESYVPPFPYFGNRRVICRRADQSGPKSGFATL